MLLFAVPLFVDELRDASADLPAELKALEARVERWLWQVFHFKPPHTMTELGMQVRDKLREQFPDVLSAASTALFGTLSYMGVVLSALIVPVFALYLLIDFDRIVGRAGDLVPRRFAPQIADVGRQIHPTLGGYVRGQLTTNIVLGALYAVGLRYVGIRLAVPIGVMTGMPRVRTVHRVQLRAPPRAVHGDARRLAGTRTLVVGVLVVMLGTQVLDGLVITPSHRWTERGACAARGASDDDGGGHAVWLSWRALRGPARRGREDSRASWGPLVPALGLLLQAGEHAGAAVITTRPAPANIPP